MPSCIGTSFIMSSDSSPILGCGTLRHYKSIRQCPAASAWRAERIRCLSCGVNAVKIQRPDISIQVLGSSVLNMSSSSLQSKERFTGHLLPQQRHPQRHAVGKGGSSSPKEEGPVWCWDRKTQGSPANQSDPGALSTGTRIPSPGRHSCMAADGF